MHHRTTAVILLATLLTSCKQEPSPAKPAAQAAPMTIEDKALEEFNQHISRFQVGIKYYRYDRRFTGVILTVPPTDPPGEDSGASGVVVLRISESTARRLAETLVRNRLLPVISLNECQLRGRAKPPAYWFWGSAEGRFGFLHDMKAGPEPEAMVRSIASALDGEAGAAVRGLLDRIAASERVVDSVKSDLWSFRLRLDPNLPEPVPSLRIRCAPLRDEERSPDVVDIRIPSEAALRIIDDLDQQGFFFRGTVDESLRHPPAAPHYTITAFAAPSGAVWNHCPSPPFAPLPRRLKWLRELLPEGQSTDQFDAFVKQLETAKPTVSPGP